MEIRVYLHSSKESMYDAGKKAGLSDKALEQFMYACYEVEVTLDVNEEDGHAKIVAVDNRRLELPVNS